MVKTRVLKRGRRWSEHMNWCPVVHIVVPRGVGHEATDTGLAYAPVSQTRGVGGCIHIALEQGRTQRFAKKESEENPYT